jgi:hypothetical protein
LESCLNTGQILFKPWRRQRWKEGTNKKCGKKGFLSFPFI